MSSQENLQTIYGHVDLQASSSTVDESCPFIPPQALHAGAAELEKVKKDGSAINTRDDVLKAIAVANIDKDSGSLKTTTTQLNSDEFESVCLKLLGTRYQQLLSVNGRMEKIIAQTLHKDMIGVIEPCLTTAEEAERLRQDEIQPALERLAALRKYCAQTVSVVGLARRRHNLQRLEAMLLTAGAWSGKVDTIKESLQKLAFVKALQIVGGGVCSFQLSNSSSSSSSLSPATNLSPQTAQLLDRREISSLFELSMKEVTVVSGESFAMSNPSDFLSEDDELRNTNERFSPSSDSEDEHHDNDENRKEKENTDVKKDHNTNLQSSASVDFSGVAAMTQAGSISKFADPNNNNNSNNGSKISNNKKAKRRREPKIQPDDVSITFLGKVSFRRWQHLCEPGNPFVLDVVRRSFCCALATGWKGIEKMDERKFAAEKLLLEIQAAEIRMEKEEEELDALLTQNHQDQFGMNNNSITMRNQHNNNYDRRSSATMSSRSISNATTPTRNKKPNNNNSTIGNVNNNKIPSISLTTNNNNNNNIKADNRKSTTTSKKKNSTTTKKKTKKPKSALDWDASSEEDEDVIVDNNNNNNNDDDVHSSSSLVADDDPYANHVDSCDEGSFSMLNKNNQCEKEKSSSSFSSSSSSSSSSSDDDEVDDDDGDHRANSNAAKQKQNAKKLFERLFSSDQRFWRSPAAPEDIKSCYDIAMAVHSALVYMQSDSRVVAQFVTECFDMTTQHVLNYTFDELFGEEKHSWTAVASTLVPSEMERGVLRFCECICAFVNRAVIIAEIFADQTQRMSSAELSPTGHHQRGNEHGENFNDHDDADGAGSHAMPMAFSFGLNSHVILKSLFGTIDKIVNSFCSSVPWTRTNLSEAVTHFQTLRVVICSAIPNVVDDAVSILSPASSWPSASQQQSPSGASRPSSSNEKNRLFLKTLVKKFIKEDVQRSLDYRISKAISKFSEKSMEEITQLMKSEMYSAFAATTDDFPDSVRPLVLSTDERIRMWGEDEENELRMLKKSKNPSNNNNNNNGSPMKQQLSSSAGSFNLDTPHAKNKRQEKMHRKLLTRKNPTAKDFDLVLVVASTNENNNKNNKKDNSGTAVDEHLFLQLSGLHQTSSALVPALVRWLETTESSCYEDTTQPPYSPLDVLTIVAGGSGVSSATVPAFTFSSSFCCRKIMDVTRAAKFCPSATSALLRTVATIACSYIYFVASTFLAPAETVPLENDQTVSDGMKSIIALCKQYATAFGCPNGYPKFQGQGCQMWRIGLASKDQCYAVEQRTGALLSLPVVVSCYRRCVQCVAALLPAEDVQSHMELFDSLSTLSKWCITRDMRKLGQNLISPEEITATIEKLKWDAPSAVASGLAATKTITTMIQSCSERLKLIFSQNQASGSKQGQNKAMREMFIACTVGIVEGIARISKKTAPQQGREALLNFVQSVFKSMRGQLPTASPKLLDATTKIASIAGENNPEVVKMFVQSNHSMFSVKQLMLVVEILDAGFMSRTKHKEEVQAMLMNQFGRDENVSSLMIIDEYCSDWVQ